jgi:hypothetical protein
MKGNNAIAFLTVNPSETLISFGEKLHDRHCSDVYIVVDNDDYTEPLSDKIKFIKIAKEDCINSCMYNSSKTSDDTSVISWDKALYFFGYVNTSYDNVWFIEHDVLVTSVDALLYLDIFNENADLICAKNMECNSPDDESWFWHHAFEHFEAPVFSSMVCACRLSNNLIDIIKNHAISIGRLLYIEFLLNTLAMKNGLKVSCPQELSTISWNQIWSLNAFQNNKMNLFHPVKNVHNHELYRNL